MYWNVLVTLLKEKPAFAQHIQQVETAAEVSMEKHITEAAADIGEEEKEALMSDFRAQEVQKQVFVSRVIKCSSVWSSVAGKA